MPTASLLLTLYRIIIIIIKNTDIKITIRYLY